LLLHHSPATVGLKTDWPVGEPQWLCPRTSLWPTIAYRPVVQERMGLAWKRGVAVATNFKAGNWRGRLP
jgi:hypothetical protein